MDAAERYRNELKATAPSDVDPNAWAFGCASAAVVILRQRCGTLSKALSRDCERRGWEHIARQLDSYVQALAAMGKGE